MKRPLLEAAVALMLGELCAVHKEVLILCILCISVRMLQRYWKDREAGRCLSEFMLLLAFFMVGNIRLQEQQDIYQSYETIEENAQVQVTGCVKTVGQKSGTMQIDMQVQVMTVTDSAVTLPDGVTVRVFTDGDVIVKNGQTIRVTGAYDALENRRNTGNFDEKEYYYGEGIAAKVQEGQIEILDASVNEVKVSLASLREKLCRNIDRSCGAEEASVLKAILFGDKTALDLELKELYRRNGIIHIISISGLHVSLLGMGVYRFLRKRYSFVPAGMASILLLVLFGCMVGFALSVKRAICMMAVRIGAEITGRTYDGLTSIALSALVVLWQNPYAMFGAAFILSYSTVTVASVLCPVLERWLWGKKTKEKNWQKTILSGIVLWVFQLPVLAGLYYEIPLYSMVLNLIVIPLMSLLFASGMAAAVVGMFWQSGAVFVCGAAAMIVRLYTLLCQWAEKLPCASVITGIPSEFRYIIFYGCIVLFLGCLFQKRIIIEEKIKRWILAGVLTVLTAGILVPEHTEELEISVLDVGQGDCTLIRTEEGISFLVDGGSSSESSVATYRIVPCLKAKGVTRLDYVLVSHGDSDHTSGIEEILQEELLEIRYLLLPDATEYLAEYQELEQLARSRGTEVVYLSAGDVLRQGSIMFSVLHPGDAVCQDINEASMVLWMSAGDFSMCFTGDISAEIEEHLFDRWQDVDVLKAAHHGSKYSSSEGFLEKTQPEIVTVSCGEHNRYGHPHQETLERYEAVDAMVYTTPECGEIDISVNIKEGSYQVQTLQGNEWKGM